MTSFVAFMFVGLDWGSERKAFKSAWVLLHDIDEMPMFVPFIMFTWRSIFDLGQVALM